MLSQYVRIVAARFAPNALSRNLQLVLPVRPRVPTNLAALPNFFSKSRPSIINFCRIAFVIPEQVPSTAICAPRSLPLRQL